MCRLEIRSTDGAMMRVDSDNACRASKTVIDGWQGADFDARDWVAPKLLGAMAVRPRTENGGGRDSGDVSLLVSDRLKSR